MIALEPSRAITCSLHQNGSVGKYTHRLMHLQHKKVSLTEMKHMCCRQGGMTKQPAASC